ncbi:MAG: hypothetical protein JWO38_1932 [Gemmataceae bacterium]|nr:hypothetical protein [Gemmataceae bacterium]
MPKPFDATLNSLIDAHVADWATFLTARAGVPDGPAAVLDTDLSSTLQADRLFRVSGPKPFALHLELESTGRLGIPDELLRYNVAARGATGFPVHSVLVLLRPKANATDQTGLYQVFGVDDEPYLTFRYTVVRIWQETVAGLLSAGPGLAPLALLTNEAAADLDAAFDRLRSRLREPDVPATVAEVVLGSTFVLSGLRYDRDRVADLYRRFSVILEDSTTYQWILEQGEAKGIAKGMTQEAHELILRLGSKRFGTPPPPGVENALRTVTDRERLGRIAERTLDAASWDDLLATP